MNTRLQVEHPISEMVSGIDIVREQLRIADGAPLGYRQAEIRLVRPCASNAGSTPKTPRRFGRRRAGSPIITRRAGSACASTARFTRATRCRPYYDSLISKLIIHGRTRNECLMRLRRALEEYVIGGIETTIPLHQRLVNAADFINGDYDIHWLERFVGRVWMRARGVRLTPEILLAAYAAGVFPMAESADDPGTVLGRSAPPRNPSARRLSRVAPAAPRAASGPVRGPLRQRLRSRLSAAAPKQPKSARTPGSTTRSCGFMRRCSPAARPTASNAVARRHAGGRPLRRVDRRAPFSAKACSAARPTRARWRWCTWSRGCGSAAIACSTPSS